MLSVSKAHINSIQHIIIKEVLRGSLHILAIISVFPYKTDLQSYDSCWELASLIIVLGSQVHFHLSVSLLQFIHYQSQYIHNFTFIFLRQHSTAALLNTASKSIKNIEPIFTLLIVLMKDLHLISIMYPINKFHHLTLKLPWVIKTEFLLTISIQYQADKW